MRMRSALHLMVAHEERPIFRSMRARGTRPGGSKRRRVQRRQAWGSRAFCGGREMQDGRWSKDQQPPNIDCSGGWCLLWQLRQGLEAVRAT